MSDVTVTLRPVATLRVGRLSSLHGAAATVDAATSDDDDTTFVKQNAAGAFAKVQFASFTVPTGAVVTGLVVRLRMRAQAATLVPLLVNGNAFGFQLSPNVGPGWRTETTFAVGGFSAQSVANGIALQWNANDEFDVAEAYLDVSYATRPTVEILQPSGPVETSQPTIEWQSDSLQAEYQVKIFSEEQFDAAGFDPTTSGALYDSGVQLGADEELVATSVNLTNGVTYRFYVRIAQMNDADPQWSQWAFVEEPMDAPVPTVPGITAVPDDTFARIKLTLTDDFTPPPTGGYGSGPYGSGPYGGGGGGGGGGSSDSWQFVTVQRSADGGLNWDPVRNATRAQVFGDTFVVYDYESCNGTDVIYRAQAINVAGGGDVASDFSTPTSAVHWSSLSTWLKSPTFPAANTTVRINELPTLTRRQPKGSFDVEARTDPVVVFGQRKLVEGTVTFVTDALSERDAIELLLNRSETLLLQTPPADDFGCRYLAFGDSDENRIVRLSTETPRLIVCPFQEVLAPVGDIVGTGISWQTVLDRFATWNDVGSGVATWEALLELTT